MQWFQNLSVSNKIAFFSLLVAFFGLAIPTYQFFKQQNSHKENNQIKVSAIKKTNNKHEIKIFNNLENNIKIEKILVKIEPILNTEVLCHSTIMPDIELNILVDNNILNTLKKNIKLTVDIPSNISIKKKESKSIIIEYKLKKKVKRCIPKKLLVTYFLIINNKEIEAYTYETIYISTFNNL